MSTKQLLIGAGIGAAALLIQSLDLPATGDGYTVLIGRLIGGAMAGAFITRVVMARFNGPG